MNAVSFLKSVHVRHGKARKRNRLQLATFGEAVQSSACIQLAHPSMSKLEACSTLMPQPPPATASFPLLYSVIFRVFRGHLSLFVIIFGLMLASAFAAESDVVARVGDTEVKMEEIRAALAILSPSDAETIARDPALLNQLVRTLLTQRILLKEALSKQWDQKPDVAAQLARVREATITESYLQSVSTPPGSFPSDADLQKAYDANKAALLVPKQFRLAQIFIASPRDVDKAAADKATEKLESVRKSLRKPDTDFAVIARTDSDEKDSSSRGGEIGWMTEAQIQPEIRAQLGTLIKNAVTEPIRLADGWHIIKCLDIKEAYTPSLEDVRSQLTQRLRAEQTKVSSQAYLAKLLQQNPVAINELVLSKALEKPSAKP